ncbi:hypothetical protein IU433_12370 [Nocardia puris]|uniref:hypothetical protein n=1 Tax=Nocardia puris TaxID=208602 RepID=UPI0018949AEA|nr:hypothetical protein [Nocardia puris]MBF6459832.1 hypothetical protein [Nocardia puris]
MSAAAQHRDQAEKYLNRAYYDGFEYANLAVASALLAVEARLADLVRQQEAANALVAFNGRVISNDADWRAARERINALLFPSKSESDGKEPC